MKCGIITYTSAQNWGGILQSYALYHYMKMQGYDVELINYRKFDGKKFKPRKNIKDIVYSVFMMRQNISRVKRYEQFRNTYLDLNNPVVVSKQEMESLNLRYDAFITGSDQLWNCETEICYDFYLEFVKDDKLLFSYGPSFGQDEIPKKFEPEVKRLLNRYNMMSVREKSGKKIVEQLTGKNIPVVCDPTFLLDKDEWVDVSKGSVLEKNYVFIYTTQVSQKVVELVKKYLLLNPDSKVVTPYAIPGVKAIVKKDIGPSEFLNYIQNADYVIGTSFHAVVFSLIFNIDFCVVPHSSTGARVNDLLSTLGLEKHIISDTNIDRFPSLDSEYYTKVLKEYISASKLYIQDMMEEAK